MWHHGGEQSGLEQPVILDVARRLGSSALSVGLTHSGYTAEDPDGRSALLNITVQPVRLPLTSAETNILASQNILLKGSCRLALPTTWKLDVSLGVAGDEEQRIRRNLNLPNVLTQIGGALPLQIKWKDVPGPMLYEWLTNSTNGLKFTIKGQARVELDVIIRVTLDHEALTNWWVRHAGESSTISWIGGNEFIAISLIEEKCLLYDSKQPSVHTFDDPLLVELTSEIAKLVKMSPDGLMSLAKTDILSWQWSSSRRTTISAVFPVSADIAPGALLLQNPDLVKDLSGNGKGLDGILGTTH